MKGGVALDKKKTLWTIILVIWLLCLPLDVQAAGVVQQPVMPIQGSHGSAIITVNDGVNPVEGATISVVVHGNLVTATTDGTGKVTVNNLPPAKYVFKVSKDGYVGATGSITVTSGTTAAASISLTKPYVGAAIIMVKDGAGQLSGAIVSAYKDGIQIERANTDMAGKATFSHLSPSSYNFRVYKSGYNDGSVNLTVTSGATASETISMVKAGTVIITVTDGAKPIQGAKVSVLNTNFIAWAMTDASGKAEFGGFAHPDGSYSFTATKPGYNAGSVTTITYTSGKTVTGAISLTMSGTAVITVKNGSTPVAGVRVNATGGSWAMTDGSGKAAFNSLNPGSYTFSATTNGTDTIGSVNLTVTSGATVTGTITVR